jgi:hypothetical protein
MFYNDKVKKGKKYILFNSRIVPIVFYVNIKSFIFILEVCKIPEKSYTKV